MRFAIAITVLVLSGVAFILGIGQRTFLAPSSEIVFVPETGPNASYAVIPAEVFTAAAGKPNVVMRGADAFIATGSVRDVEAWVQVFDHVEIAADAETRRLTVQAVRGDGSTLADDASEDPRGSDLWLTERRAEGPSLDGSEPGSAVTSLPVSVQSDQAVLVAAADGQRIGENLSVVWTQDRRTPFAGPLLVAGGVLAVLGGILYLLAVDHDRRGLGPRRGRKGPLQGIRGSMQRRRDVKQLQRVSLPAVALVGALALSGCSPSYWPDFSGQQTQTPEVAPQPQQTGVAPVPVTSQQIDRILDDIVSVAATGDESLDAAVLESRFTGDALRQRTANYTIRAAVPDYPLVPPQLTDEQLSYDLVQSTQGWPRTVFVALASGSDASADDAAEETTTDEAAPSLAVIMTQVSPHHPYLVSRIITLRGGIDMPEAAPVEEGTALLPPDLQTLAMPPGEVAAAFSAVLQSGLETPEAEFFELTDDPLIARSGQAWVAEAQQRAEAEGFSIQYSVAVQPGAKPITALSVSDSGALVAVTVVEERISDTAGSTTRVRAEGAVSALSGLTGQQELIISEVAHQLLFFVPSKTSGERIQLLGATSELVGARNQ